MVESLGATLSIWWALPFAGLLLSIALLPLWAPQFWHRRYPMVSLFWALCLALPFVAVHRGEAIHHLAHAALVDYAPFVILLWGLFTVSGGIVVQGQLPGTPAGNTALLAAGTLLASWVGTTGAAMVLIRPLLRANAERRRKVHTVIFFIFLVGNIGGSLTPLGDPPLFLGFLHGVPFFWTFRMLGPMVLCATILLPLYFVIDSRAWRREDPAPPERRSVQRRRRPALPRLAIAGWPNALLLAGIVGAVLLSGLWKSGAVPILGVERAVADLVRDALIVFLGVLSLALTRRELRRENEFSWGPIREVAILFAGIFATMVPALLILRAGEQGALGLFFGRERGPVYFFWASGGLSSFLDNAPTYLTFFSAALGRFHPGLPEAAAVHALIDSHGVHLLAIAAGSVFMGANTYIGNAPNFMIRSIAVEAGVEMPSFFGYMLRWSLPVLIPVFVVVTLVFFV